MSHSQSPSYQGWQIARDQRQADAADYGQMDGLLNWVHKSLAFIPPDLLGRPRDQKNLEDGTEACLFSTGKEWEVRAHHNRESTEDIQLSVPEESQSLDF